MKEKRKIQKLDLLVMALLGVISITLYKKNRTLKQNIQIKNQIISRQRYQLGKLKFNK